MVNDPNDEGEAEAGSHEVPDNGTPAAEDESGKIEKMVMSLTPDELCRERLREFDRDVKSTLKKRK